MCTYNRLDLQTLGFQPVMPKNLPDRCTSDVVLFDYINGVGGLYVEWAYKYVSYLHATEF